MEVVKNYASTVLAMEASSFPTPPPPSSSKSFSAILLVTLLLVGLVAGGLTAYLATYSDF